MTDYLSRLMMQTGITTISTVSGSGNASPRALSVGSGDWSVHPIHVDETVTVRSMGNEASGKIQTSSSAANRGSPRPSSLGRGTGIGDMQLVEEPQGTTRELSQTEGESNALGPGIISDGFGNSEGIDRRATGEPFTGQERDARQSSVTRKNGNIDTVVGQDERETTAPGSSLELGSSDASSSFPDTPSIDPSETSSSQSTSQDTDRPSQSPVGSQSRGGTRISIQGREPDIGPGDMTPLDDSVHSASRSSESGRVSSSREPETRDLHLSIGTISVIVENPAEEDRSIEAARNSSRNNNRHRSASVEDTISGRLSRHYLR